MSVDVWKNTAHPVSRQPDRWSGVTIKLPDHPPGTCDYHSDHIECATEQTSANSFPTMCNIASVVLLAWSHLSMGERHPGQVASSSHGHVYYRRPFTHTFTPMGNLEWPTEGGRRQTEGRQLNTDQIRSQARKRVLRGKVTQQMSHDSGSHNTELHLYVEFVYLDSVQLFQRRCQSFDVRREKNPNSNVF